MATDADSQTPEAQREPSQPVRTAKKKKKGKKVKLARPLDEREINAPDLQTLLMLGALAALGVTLWVFAHAGCNYHPPRETRRPRNVTTAELTRDPKDAAIELQQRIATFDYKGALEIAAGPLAQQLEGAKAECERDRAACDTRKQALAKAISMGVVLTRDPMSAKVRVTTHNVPDGPKKFLMLVERDGSGWKVTARVADTPDATLPPPSLAPATRMMPSLQAPPGAAPSDAASAAPRLELPPGHP